ncbi:substrate-binding domain-containing protein [Nocardia terpenica]|uniref:VWA domain-containing protein n=1 Tax=Nocardia terpenica TaxID=455432 RepID=A0A6G9Z2B8_9NOCA|nr:substrate-binding domain-containing protein [Nocardia terpenica]QIS19745.1 VWA domain-containing protein [Nocardia terpenica]
MGTHRSAAGSRGVSKGLVISIAAALLVVAVIGGWFWLNRQSASQDRSAASGCLAGPTTLAVTVDPALATPVRAAADRYNATKPTVRDHCVTVAVAVQPSAAMVAGFTAKAWDAKLGPQPALWIPDSSRSIEQMRVPGLVQGAPVPIAASPIVLAVPDPLRQALEQAKTSWSDLPRLQQGSLGDIGLGGWGGLRMALPGDDETLAVAAAVGANVSGSDPLTDQAARSGQVIAAISQLAAGAPRADDAVSTLSGVAGSAADAPVHTLAVTEQQLKAKGGVGEYRPAGSTPMADYPAALLSGQWVDKTQNLIAGLFADYLRAPEQQKLFTDEGFAAAPAATTPVPPKSVLDQVHSALTKPVLGMQTTVLIDTSAAMGITDGSLTRLGNTLGAVQSTMDTMPPDFGLGVQTYANDAENKVLSPTAPLSQQHRADLAKALSNVSATSAHGDHTYPALEAAYHTAVTEYATGRTNSVLLITGGPNDDSTVTPDQLLADITAATDPAHPIRIDIIVLGGPGAPTLQTLAQKTGGTYTRLPTSDDLTFGTAVNQALTTP